MTSLYKRKRLGYNSFENMVKHKIMEGQNKMIYWDNSATTQVCSEAIEAMNDVMVRNYGNPSSLHRMGVDSEKKVKEARGILARMIGAKDKEVFFCSGGTEANNMALLGLARGNRRNGLHIVSTQIEHPSVLRALDYLESEGFRITKVFPDQHGIVQPETILSAVEKDTILVSTMMVNNETGALMAVEEIGKGLKGLDKKVLFHVDAVQSFGKLSIDVNRFCIDALSASAHKIHGPKGVGLCFLRESVKYTSLLYGGGQELGVRPGTENVPGIVGFAAAARVSAGQKDFLNQMKALKKSILEGLNERGVEYSVNGDIEECVPYILNLSFPNTKSEVLLHSLESKGIFVSSGSACSSKKKAFSPVLKAMGLKEDALDSAIRLSFSTNNCSESLDEGLDILKEVVSDIQSIMNRSTKWKR